MSARRIDEQYGRDHQERDCAEYPDHGVLLDGELFETNALSQRALGGKARLMPPVVATAGCQQVASSFTVTSRVGAGVRLRQRAGTYRNECGSAIFGAEALSKTVKTGVGRFWDSDNLLTGTVFTVEGSVALTAMPSDVQLSFQLELAIRMQGGLPGKR